MSYIFKNNDLVQNLTFGALKIKYYALAKLGNQSRSDISSPPHTSQSNLVREEGAGVVVLLNIIFTIAFIFSKYCLHFHLRWPKSYSVVLQLFLGDDIRTIKFLLKTQYFFCLFVFQDNNDLYLKTKQNKTFIKTDFV